MSPDAPTTFRIPAVLIKGLQSVKARDGVPHSEQVRRALVSWLESKGIDPETGEPKAEKQKRGRVR